MKQFCSFFLALVMCGGLFVFPAGAISTDKIEKPVDEILMAVDSDLNRAPSKPTRYKNLGGNNDYTAELVDLEATKTSFTDHYFGIGTDTLYLTLELEHSGTTTDKSRRLQIALYEMDDADDIPAMYKEAQTISFSGDITRTRSFSGLDPDKFYFFGFRNVSADSPNSGMDISAIITIDDDQ